MFYLIAFMGEFSYAGKITKQELRNANYIWNSLS